MKTQIKKLEKVIERNDYKKLSLKLAKKTEELADRIIEKMIELQIVELENLRLKTIQVDDFIDYYLIIDSFYFENNCYISSGALNFNKRNKGRNKSRIYFTNMTAIYTSNDNEALYFLDNFKKYLIKLDEIETKKSEKIKETLKEVENL